MPPTPSIATNADARVALGIAATWLKLGYKAASTMTWTAASARVAAIGLLDSTNKYAQAVYKKLPADKKPLTPQLKTEVALALKQCADNLKLVSTEARNLSTGFLGALVRALVAAGQSVVKAADTAGTSYMMLALLALYLSSRRR
jgi:hypothetical protein